jgi:hypothetical protein
VIPETGVDFPELITAFIVAMGLIIVAVIAAAFALRLPRIGWNWVRSMVK